MNGLGTARTRDQGRNDQVKAGLRIINEFTLFLLCEDLHNRKNYLFLGSDAGGERAATMYSLLGTVKLNGINPETYLRHVLSVIADYPVNRVDELLPWNLNLNNESLLNAA